MDLRQLRSFVTIARTLNFGAAARQLYLSQSALSVQIQSLESHLGATLFERSRRSVRLTAAGEALLADSHALLQQVAEIELRTRKIGSGEVGNLRIAFVASATEPLIPAIVLAFQQRYKGVELSLRNLTTVQQIDALKNGSIDAGFLRMPLSEPGLAVESIHRERFAMVVAHDHALASEETLSVDLLAGEPFIVYGRKWAPSFYDHWTALCRESGFTPNVVQEVAEMDTALVLVAAGLGVGIFPEGIARRNRYKLTVRPLVSERIFSEIGLAVRTDHTTPLIQRFLAIAAEFGLC